MDRHLPPVTAGLAQGRGQSPGKKQECAFCRLTGSPRGKEDSPCQAQIALLKFTTHLSLLPRPHGQSEWADATEGV